MRYIYSVYDKKAMVYNTPFVVENPIDAVRAFSELVSDCCTTVGKYPGDFALYCVGKFSTTTGIMFLSDDDYDFPCFVHEAMEFVRKSAVGEGHEVSEPTTTLPAAGAEE